MYLFFDTETTGLPKNYKAPVTDTNNWPRMIQIGWILCDARGNKLEEGNYIIKPEGFEIPIESSRVHGITTDKAIQLGAQLDEVLRKFESAIQKATTIIAHNISFDEKIVGAEFIRKNLPTTFDFKSKICTMNKATEYCQIPGRYGYKWPTLSELHIKLFGKDFDGAHDAFADISATVDCFWEMKKRNIL